MATYVERLAEIEAAITAVLEGGQEVRYEGRVVRRADLVALNAERKRLEPLARQETRPAGLRVVMGVPT